MIRRVDWVNPHVYLHLEGTSSTGEAGVWAVEAGPPNLMARGGWSSDSVRPGERVVVAAYPARSVSATTVLGKSLLREDGVALSIEDHSTPAVGASQFASELLGIVLELPGRNPAEVAVDPNIYDRYAGSYAMNDFRLTFVREDDRLLLDLDGQRIPVFAESMSDYFFEAFSAQVTFVTEGGPATGVILHEGGIDTYLSRVK